MSLSDVIRKGIFFVVKVGGGQTQDIAHTLDKSFTTELHHDHHPGIRGIFLRTVNWPPLVQSNPSMLACLDFF